MNPIPDLVDNRKHPLAQVLRDLLAGAHEPTLDVVTAFFNLKGLEEVLSPTIERVTRFRLLLGKEQEQSFVVGERLLAELEDAAARGETTASQINNWRDFLARDHVEIRRYLKTFCHGKAYILTGVPALGEVSIVGSSNFTGAGLTTNLELNAVLKQTSAVHELQDWFESLWAEAEDYKAELLALLERFTCAYTPYEIYIKVVYEALHDKLEQDLAERDDQPSPIALADFQRDGYLAATEVIENYGGVLIADSVGLGKTYLALRLLDDYAYKKRETALIICPKGIEDTVWRPLLRQHAIPHEIISMEKVSQEHFPVEDYGRRFRIVVVDESHNFRNAYTKRWRNMFDLIRQGEPQKKVILLTATPVNNTLLDLYHQLLFITRGDRRALLAAGIENLEEYFKRAEQRREALYEVLEALAVRRSRQFIRENYPDAKIDGQKIRFPDRKLHTVRYSLKQTYGEDLYRQIAQAIEDLRLAPYQIETYRREVAAHRPQDRLPSPENPTEPFDSAVKRLQVALGWSKEQAQEFFMTVGRQTALAHIMRVLYLKRLESSAEALRISLGRLRSFLKRFLEALERGRLLSSEDYRKWLQLEGGDEEGTEENDFERVLASLREVDTDRYDMQSLRTDIKKDLDALNAVLSNLDKGLQDDKLKALKELLTSRGLKGKKVVVFSYFKNTARYIYQQLRQDRQFLSGLGHHRIAIVDSGVSASERTGQVRRFAPPAHGRSDVPRGEQIDLLISTDALSEGQNLQDGEAIVNYDLHWNPVRMVQRIGRLDRLGSPHGKIHVYNFFPEQELEDILGLLSRLHQKLEAINRTVGLDASVLGETPNPKEFNILRRIQGEDGRAVEDLEAERELSVGEFLKQDLLRFLKELSEKELRDIPYGVGTARRKKKDGRPGFFAAFRNPKTGHHHWLFCDDTGKVIERNLEAIAHIQCERSEQAHPLPEGFDPREHVRKQRRHLWNRIRVAEHGVSSLPSPQNQVVNWLRASAPSEERYRLLQYFEGGPLSRPDLKELRRLWKERSSFRESDLTARLLEFAEHHPHPEYPVARKPSNLAPEKEEELECVAWMSVV